MGLVHLRPNRAAWLFLFMLGLGVLAQAQSPARRFVNAKAAPGGDGLSWATAFSTIQPAVDAATSTGGEVWVAEGTYTGTGSQVVNIPATVKLYGGFAGSESTLTGRNPATHQTVIDGQKTRQGVNNAGLLDGFVVQNGSASDGGGVYNYHGTVTGCTMTNNTAGGWGGGVYNLNGTVTGCTVADNHSHNDGGGVYNDQAGTMIGCTVTDNSANLQGGGVCNVSGTVTGCTAAGNSAGQDGGGVWNGNGTVTGCTVTDNSASNSGSGIYNSPGDNIFTNPGTVTNCIIWGNRTIDIGGYRSTVSYSCFAEATVDNHNLRANPCFVSTAGNDPQAWDLRLSPGSPCIDVGNKAAPSLPATDLLGHPRPGGDGHVDMGAYESPDAYMPGAPAPSVVLYVSPQGNGTTGKDWTTAFNSIASAAQSVQVGYDLYEIRVARGTYREGGEIVLPSRASLVGGWSGNPAKLQERDVAAFKTIIDGEKRRYRCLTNHGLLDGLWIQNGSADSGGGVYNYGTVKGCTVTSSSASSGGGIYNSSGAVSGCTVTGNSASGGGGIYTSSGTVTGCRVTGNSASNRGGGIDNYSGTVIGCTISGNSEGGVFNYHGTVTGCTVAGNSATSLCGGIYNYGIVTNCIVAGNSTSSDDDSGGICNVGTVTGCTVTGNSAGGGAGGIYNSSGDYDTKPGTVTNCIVWRNGAIDIDGELSTISYSCFGEANGANHNLRANPRFVSTAGNDPLAWDLRLNSNSPCIDAGTTAAPSLPTTDIAGNSRLGGDGRVDMGAYESPDAYVPGAPAPPMVLYVSSQGDGTTGQDWARAFKTITSAFPAVQAGGDLYEIRVAAGTYHEGRQIVLPSRASLIGGWSGNPSKPQERNATEFKTIIDGEKKYRCFTNRSLLDGLWIQNGFSYDYGGGVCNYDTVTDCIVTSNSGSGINNDHGTVTGCTVTGNSVGGINNNHGTVIGCTVMANSSQYSGGGIYNYSGTVTDCTVTDNFGANYGGGIYSDSGTVTGCTVTSNTTSGEGGGIFNESGTVTGCTMTGNYSAYSGGGIWNYDGTVTGCMVTGNSAGSGGGIDNGSGTITGCTVTGNSSTSEGGGIFNNNGTVSNCTVTGNSANGAYGDGGGIHNSNVVLNCIVTGNFACRDGGGIYNDYDVGILVNCTVTGNSASRSGGGIYNYYGPVTNCIVWRNSKSDIIEGDSGSIVTYSCFGEATDSDHNLHADPRFVSTAGDDPLAWNLHLQAGSPCIGAGTTEAKDLPATDIEGKPRPGNDGLVDMGAYELPFSRIIRYLLGLETDPTGLDANGDGKVDIADAVSQVNAIPPADPTAPIPADQATTISLTPRFRWTAAPYARSYDLYLWKATETTPTTPLVSGLPTPSCDAPATLSYATVYKWRVTAHNVTAQTAGPVWQFTTRPYPVRVVSPNGGNTWTRGTNVQVRYVADVRNSGTSYRIELWRGNSKTATLKTAVSNTVGDKTETIALPKTLAAASNYKVRVISVYMESHNGGPDAWDASDQPFTIK